MVVEKFEPLEALIPGPAAPECRAVVIVPARNEESCLASTLNALAVQIDLDGQPWPANRFEIILLLNNCTDQSVKVATEWKNAHPDTRLHIAERTFPSHQAFVGTARRMLMDTAWHRLHNRSVICGILSTDADTVVHQEWVARNMAALESGADAVGGFIELTEEDLSRLPEAVCQAYQRDRQYQHLVAELEDHLDPQAGDPWPRHLQHYGASLACTPKIYALAGGMPPVTPLEDVAFVGRLRRIGAKLRHHPDVKVFTSSRMEGRVEVGLSGQLNLWQQMSTRNEQHRVQSAAWIAHRFKTLRRLRAEAVSEGVPAAEYLAQVDCDCRVEQTFRGQVEDEITRVNSELAAMLRNLR